MCNKFLRHGEIINYLLQTVIIRLKTSKLHKVTSFGMAPLSYSTTKGYTS